MTDDGCLPRCRTGLEVCSRSFKEGITAVKQLGGAGDSRLLLLGFSDGSVRAVRGCGQGWRLEAALRPHQVGCSGPGREMQVAAAGTSVRCTFK